MLYFLKSECSMMSNMTFSCVNAIQLSPSPFNSSPQCKKKALYVIISAEIPENLVHKSYCVKVIFDDAVNFFVFPCQVVPRACLSQIVPPLTPTNTHKYPQRVVLPHFRERVDESPHQDENFGTFGLF